MDSVFSVIGSYVDWDVRSLLFFMAIFIITADYIKRRRPDSFPPGPRTLPFAGNMFAMDYRRLHEHLTQLAGDYGAVYSLRMGPRWVVVLNGLKVLREALVNQGDGVSDRPILPIVLERSNGKGIIFTSGSAWKEQRQFAFKTLKYFGSGKKSLEPVILDEFTYCAKDISSYKGKPLNPHFIINKAFSNVVCHLVFGHRFEYDDEKFTNLMYGFGKAFEMDSSMWAQLFNTFPQVMRHLPGPHQTTLQFWENSKDLIKNELKEHKQNWDPSDQRDFIDCYLTELQMNKGQTSNSFDEENMVICIMDLFAAGTETTSTSLRWAFLYMAKYPEIQAKVQAEIDRVIGQSRKPSMEDHPNLPYTHAVIHEVQRMGNIVPLSGPHFTSKDIQLRGYTIPKGVTVIPNLTSVHYDKNEWETPYTFNPGHFLNEEGKFVKPPAFVPFSAGKRLCPGENLAKMELFIFFTSFMQHFTLSMPAGVEAGMEYNFGVTLAPVDYEICITSRSESF